MRTIVYASRAVRAMEPPELAEILDIARARNGDRDVTGMLLYAQGSFLQQLEGGDDAVEETFSRIERDDRHTDVRVLARRQIDDRRFPEWRMGFRHPDVESLGLHLTGYQAPGDAPLVSSELIYDAEIAESLLGLYALADRD